jgi:hypothetical protein
MNARRLRYSFSSVISDDLNRMRLSS